MPRSRSRRGKMIARPRRAVRSVGPPQYDSYVPYRHTYRYEFSSSNGELATFALNTSQMLCAFGSIASTTTNLRSFFTQFRLLKLECWASALSSSAGTYAATVDVAWANSAESYAPPSRISDTTVTPSFPAHIVAVPPKNSGANFWQGVTNVTLLDINVNGNLIVDVTVMLGCDGAGASQAITGPATVGDIYQTALDGPSTNLLLPVSFPTIN